MTSLLLLLPFPSPTRYISFVVCLFFFLSQHYRWGCALCVQIQIRSFTICPSVLSEWITLHALYCSSLPLPPPHILTPTLKLYLAWVLCIKSCLTLPLIAFITNNLQKLFPRLYSTNCRCRVNANSFEAMYISKHKSLPRKLLVVKNFEMRMLSWSQVVWLYCGNPNRMCLWRILTSIRNCNSESTVLWLSTKLYYCRCQPTI